MAKVFVSYSWDSEEYKKQIKQFVQRLKQRGIDIIFDGDAHLGERLPDFMETNINMCDYVLMCCTPLYKEKADARLQTNKQLSGVGYENTIITAEIYNKNNQCKFIPILFKGTWETSVPQWATSKLGIDLTKDNEEEFERLVQTLVSKEKEVLVDKAEEGLSDIISDKPKKPKNQKNFATIIAIVAAIATIMVALFGDVGKFDIEVVSEAVREHYYLLSGDFEHIQGIVDAPFLAMNGVIYFNEWVKEDRRAASKKMIAHLRNQGNLLYFLEGTWNLSPNLPVLPCYWGIIDVAREGGAVIIPIAAEQYGKHFVINIGKNFNVAKYEPTTEGKSGAIAALRDVLATLKWEIWEHEPIVERSRIREGEWKQYVEDRLHEWPYFTMDYIDSMTYSPKNVARPQDVFASVMELKWKKETAFLFEKD